jgi:hypothetical protein
MKQSEYLEQSLQGFFPATKAAVCYMLGTLEEIEARYALMKACEADLADVPVLRRDVSMERGMESLRITWSPKTNYHSVQFSFADTHEVFVHFPLHATKEHVAKQLRDTAELLDPTHAPSYGGTE